MNELFQIPESKSPRLLWMERHGIRTREVAPGKWDAWSHHLGRGESEDEAITQMALKLGIKLWNETEVKPSCLSAI